MNAMRTAGDRAGRGRRRAAAAAALLALAAGCDAGRTGRGQIQVTTVPEGAQIECNGRRYDSSPVAIPRLPSGTYLISATRPGHLEARQNVSLLEGQRVAVELRLEPLEGLALIVSQPPGAKVTLDGAFRGTTPFFVHDLAFGEHRLQFAAAGHLPMNIVVDVKDRVPQKIQADLVADAGQLVVRSEPAGATVRLNGAERGVTPCDIPDAPSGENTIEVVLEGYAPHVEKLSLRAQERREIAASLKALPTTLRIVSVPPGARVYVDNQFRGEAPLTLGDLAPGTHRVRAEMPGHEPSARDVSLLRETPVVEEFRMVKNSGKLVLVTEPAQATVYIDGVESGVTPPSPRSNVVSLPLEIDFLAPGAHQLQLQRSGYVHRPVSFTIEANGVTDLHQKMSRRYVADTRIRIKAASGAIVREGMLLKKDPAGDVELQLESGTIMKIRAQDIEQIERL
jgi:hypothetical protein